MRHFLPILLLAALAACTSRPDPETAAADALWAAVPGGWNEIPGGEATVCSNGTPYAFYFRPGERERLLVFFQGGGACWDPVNCDLADKPTYDPFVDSTDNPGATAALRYGWQGIFDLANPANPFRAYSVLVVPYCTADVHLGNREYTYEKGDSSLVIRHNGYRNAMAALEWVYARMPAPAEIFVTGASAGSIASPVYAALIADHYTQAHVVNLGDCSGAYRGKAVAGIMERWGSADVLRAAGVDNPDSLADFNEAIIAVGEKHPNLTITQYNTAYDEVQQFFLGQLGESPDSTYAYIRENMTFINRALPDFRYYIDTGTHHVILQRPEFYTTAGAGVPLREWVSDLARGAAAKTVQCAPCGK